MKGELETSSGSKRPAVVGAQTPVNKGLGMGYHNLAGLCEMEAQCLYFTPAIFYI